MTWRRKPRPAYVDDPKLKNHHDSHSSIVLARLKRRTRLRIRFWAWLSEYTEAKWLEANGWTRVRNGWLLPEWHPHKMRARGGSQRFDFMPGPGVPMDNAGRQKEPYSQNHAMNSQRYHCMCIQQPPLKRYTRLPRYPAYVRWLPYQLAVFGVTMVCFMVSTMTDSAVHLLFCVAGTISALIGFVLSWTVQKDLELDYTEFKLRSIQTGTEYEQATEEVHGMR